MKFIFVLGALILLLDLVAGSEPGPERERITRLPAHVDLSGYSALHTFSARDGVTLAVLYGRPSAPGVFSELLFIDPNSEPPCAIYLVDGGRFLGVHGVDSEPHSSTFYGYMVVLKAPQHVVVNYLSDEGKSVSDDVTISWRQEHQRFELEKTP